MYRVSITLLGRFDMAWPARTTPALPSRAQALLALLVLHPDRPFRRDMLAGTFWGDSTQEKARASVRSALWRLRRVLEPDGVAKGTYLRTAGAGDVSFNRDSAHDLDVTAFEHDIAPALEGADQVLTDGALVQLQNGLERYAGDLLEGFDDDWILPERERLRCAYINALACQMHNLKLRGRYEAALACGRRILAREPLRESIHREMMRLYAGNGERAEALRHYARCGELLARELGVQPMPETRALYNELRTREAPRSPPPASARPAVDAQRFLAMAIDHLAHAIHEVQVAAARVAEQRTANGEWRIANGE